MATYKAVMRPALEYASSIWPPLAYSTSINKLQVMQNAALRTATGCTQDTNIQHLHDETLIFPYTSTYSSTPHNTNIKHIIHHIRYTHNILHHSNAQKPTIFNNGRYTTIVKTNMRHIHSSIVSRHLATRGNNKILHTPPPHISSSEEILPRLTRRTLAQLRTNKSPFLKSTYTKSMPNHIHHHYAPSVTSTHTTHIISSTASTYAPHCHPWICGQAPTE